MSAPKAALPARPRRNAAKRLARHLLIFAIVIGICLATARPSPAQFALPFELGQIDISSPPPEVNRYGNIETIAVRSPLSNRILFAIASPTVEDRRSEALSEQRPVEQRARQIQSRLLLLLERDMDPETLTFGVARLNNVTVIDAKDANYTRPLVLVSVTDLDADYNGVPVEELAGRWRELLEADLHHGITDLPKDQQKARRVLAGLAFVSSITLGLKYGLSRRQKRLRGQKKALDDALATDTDKPAIETPIAAERDKNAPPRLTLMQALQRGSTLDRRLAILDALQWLLFWLLVMVWYGSTVWIYAVAPHLLVDSLSFLETSVSLLTIWFVASLTIRISHRVIDYFSVEREGFDLGDFLSFGDVGRRQIRTATIARACKGLLAFAIALVGMLLGLSKLGVPAASVVAVGSLVGLAVAFAAQSLVKDLVNGFFILAEDQYGVGDIIDTSTAFGSVENLTMRVTQLRSPDGELITIPNSAIAQVRNLTRNWSRVALSIEVAYDTDPDEALDVLREVSRQFYTDPEWHRALVSEPQVLGIDRVTHSGMTIAVWIETEPAQQWAAGREFRLRVRRALAARGIAIGTPRQTYQLATNAIAERRAPDGLFAPDSPPSHPASH